MIKAKTQCFTECLQQAICIVNRVNYSAKYLFLVVLNGY